MARPAGGFGEDDDEGPEPEPAPPGPQGDLVLPGAVSAPPRAVLVEVAAAGRRTARLEVRPCTLFDRLAYVGHLASLGVDDDADLRELWPRLVIPSTYAPVYEDGEWQPGHPDARRVFRWRDQATILRLPWKTLDDLHDQAAKLCGLDMAWEKHIAWAVIRNGEFRLVLDHCNEWGRTLYEMSTAMPSWEVTVWRAYWGVVAAERALKDSKGGRSVDMESFAEGAPG